MVELIQMPRNHKVTTPVPPLKNEAFALKCRQTYERLGVEIGPDNGEFAHTPVPKCLGGTTGVWLTHEDHQAQGILQADDFGMATFFQGHVKKWLITGNFPDADWFALWDMFERWTSHSCAINGQKHTSTAGGQTTFERGVGLFAQTKEQLAANGRKGVKTQKERKVGIFAPGQHGKPLKEKWISTIDGFVSSASGVARHNKKLGWDPFAKKKIDETV